MEDVAYRERVEAFRREREASLVREDGWLSQVALIFFEAGRVESEIGSFSEIATGVRFIAREGCDVRRGGEVMREALLDPVNDEGSDVLTADSVFYQLVRRGGTLAVRVRDPRAPARRGFRGLSWYPIDPSWRLTGTLIPIDEMRMMLSFTGGQSESVPVAALISFAAADHQHRLLPYVQPDGSLLIVFRDQTNARETSSMCRYFYAPAPDANGHVVLDFNLAAAPICDFVPFVTCVVPPPENSLPFRVEAGELRYTDEDSR